MTYYLGDDECFDARWTGEPPYNALNAYKQGKDNLLNPRSLLCDPPR